MVGYIDDFGALPPSGIAKEDLFVSTQLCVRVGIVLKSDKSQAANKITFLGLLVGFPNSDSDFHIRISLRKEKAERWASAVEEIITQGAITRDPIGKLIWELIFSQTSIFGKFARTMTAPLYTKLHARNFIGELSLRGGREFMSGGRAPFGISIPV